MPGLTVIGQRASMPYSTLPTLISTACYVVRNSTEGADESVAIRPMSPQEVQRDSDQPQRAHAALLLHRGRHTFDPAALKVVPEWPLIYWWNSSLLAEYAALPLLGDSAPAVAGLRTSDNIRFVRNHWECSLSSIWLEKAFREQRDPSGVNVGARVDGDGGLRADEIAGGPYLVADVPGKPRGPVLTGVARGRTPPDRFARAQGKRREREGARAREPQTRRSRAGEGLIDGAVPARRRNHDARAVGVPGGQFVLVQLVAPTEYVPGRAVGNGRGCSNQEGGGEGGV